MKSIFLSGTALICVLFIAGASKAQMVGSDIFLKGKYVEIGIANPGWYGTTASPPAGYHPYPAGGGLGFVADPDMDGWTVGTPPYFGDYFLPGLPTEGWELQVNGPRCSAFNPTFTSDGITGTGSNISYSTSGTKVSGTWQGTFDSIQVNQVTTLDTNTLYFTVNVTLTNLSVAPVDNIYYLRTVDPDNDETRSSSFVTFNKIDHQSTDTTVVSSAGTVYSSAYLAMGTTDTNATSFIELAWPLDSSVNLSALYNEISPAAYYADGTTNTGDNTIGLVIKVPHLATIDSATDSVYRTTSTSTLHPANSSSFTYFYAFSPAAVDSAIKDISSSTTSGALGVQNINTIPDIKVYPNPSKDLVNITGLTTADHLSLIDMMGRQAVQNWVVNKNGTNTFSYSNIPSGVYIIVVTDANGNVRARVPIRKI